MLKNEQLIYKMSVEQKVEFILSSKERSNSQVGSYEFPTFLMKNDPLKGYDAEFATFFPSDKALASSYNMKLVAMSYNLKGIENKASLNLPFFNVTNNPEVENISENVFLTSKFIASKVSGLNSCGAVINYEQYNLQAPIHELKESLTYFKHEILKDNYFDSILVNDEKELYEYKLTHQNNKVCFAKATSKEQALKLILSGCCLVYVDDSILEETQIYISECVNKYKSVNKDYLLKKISKSAYTKELESEDILNEQILDNACDALMNLIVDLSNCKRTISERLKSMAGELHPAKFNQFAHNEQAANFAKETIVMLKNNRVLPFKFKDRLAIIGEYAKEENLVIADFTNKATSVNVIYNSINDYDLTTTGFAYGYKQDVEDNEALLKAASDLAKESDYAVVFLYAKESETSLPVQQLELIDRLYQENVKIVAVISANGAIDMSFADKCEAILFTYNSGQNTAKAVLDIVGGLDNPNAKLIDTLYATNEEEKVVKYPFGYGLSYSTFEYYNLEVKDSYVCFNITNTSEVDGFAIPLLYILKENSESTLNQLQLKGFNKIFLKAHETLKVEIPLDENTFKTFDEKTQKYVVEGGQYQVIIAENAQEVKVKGTLTLARYIYDDDGFTSVVVDSSNDLDTLMQKFAKTESKKEYLANGKGVPFGLKITLSILLAVYFNAIIAILLFGSLNISANPILLGVLVLLFILVNLFVTLYIIKAARRRIAFLRKTPNETLTKVISTINEFEEIEKTLFKEPVSEEVIEEQEEITEEISVSEEAKEVVYQNTFEEDEEVLFKDNLTLPELCNNFREFASSKGINVEPSSVRTIFASLASSKIIFLDIKNKELQPKFLEILNEYFNNTGMLSANENFSSLFDLMWKENEGTYIPTEFIKTVRTAENDKKRTSIVILDNVSMTNLYSYFDTFIEYSVHPSEVYEIELNEETKIVLPANINYILIPTEDDYTEKFNKTLAKGSISIEVIIGKAKEEEKHEEVEIKSIAYPELLTLIAQAKENHYLPEKIWKKVDELVETINLTEKFVFGNKNMLQLERFTSTLIECGGDEQEAFSIAFTSKIVPVLKTLKTYKKENGDKTIFGIIEKIFDDEDLAKIQKTLMKKI